MPVPYTRIECGIGAGGAEQIGYALARNSTVTKIALPSKKFA